MTAEHWRALVLLAEDILHKMAHDLERSEAAEDIQAEYREEGIDDNTFNGSIIFCIPAGEGDMQAPFRQFHEPGQTRLL